MQQELSVSIMECNYIDTGTRTVWGILIKKKNKTIKQNKTLPIEKAESNRLAASSTWISNQQTRTAEPDWQTGCPGLTKKPNLNRTTIKKKKSIRKYQCLLDRSFAPWLKTRLVVTRSKVCVLLPGRALTDGAVLCKSNHRTDTERYRSAHPLFPSLAAPVG